MAALAIDVVTLYVAHTEAQRAADAASLAGARMIAGSGYTSAGPSWNGGDSTPLCQTSGPGATAAANQQAEAAAAQNLIAGQPGAVLQITCNMSPGNPQFTVAVQRTNLPTFFARIWGRTASTVTATSTAEAYNPSWSPNSPPVAFAVKPWLLPNCDVGHAAPQNRNCTGAAAYFFSPVDGSLQNNALFLGTLIHLRAVGANPAANRYYHLDIPINPPTPVCPGASSGNDYEDNIECSSTFQVSCGQQIGVSTAPLFTVLTAGGLGPKTNQGVQTLIHATGYGLLQGQDTFTTTSPVTIGVGLNNPNYAALSTYSSISRSDSIVTVPLYDGQKYNAGQFCTPLGVCAALDTVMGFAQLGITQNVQPAPNGQIDAVILNIVGCPVPGSPPPVTGGGVSAIPVRLVHQ
jgi:hypothetical protein